MSFIGPRPEQMPVVKELRDSTPYYVFRHAVRPGITGWAQVNQGYVASKEGSLHKLEYDLYYVQNMSLSLDLTIIYRTLWFLIKAPTVGDGGAG